MIWHSLPLFVRIAGRPVILLGEGEAAAAKRRLLERAGAMVVADHPDARLAIVAIEGEAEGAAAVAALKARGILVNAVDRPALCDFTLPAIVDRDPVLVAIGTGGMSAGLAAALRQRLEGWLPAGLGTLADALFAARDRLRVLRPDGGERRRAIARALRGEIDPMAEEAAQRVSGWIDGLASGASEGRSAELVTMVLASPDPDELTLRQARLLADADRVVHAPDVPAAILDRARADAARIPSTLPPAGDEPGLTIHLEMAR